MFDYETSPWGTKARERQKNITWTAEELEIPFPPEALEQILPPTQSSTVASDMTLPESESPSPGPSPRKKRRMHDSGFEDALSPPTHASLKAESLPFISNASSRTKTLTKTTSVSLTSSKSAPNLLTRSFGSSKSNSGSIKKRGTATVSSDSVIKQLLLVKSQPQVVAITLPSDEESSTDDEAEDIVSVPSEQYVSSSSDELQASQQQLVPPKSTRGLINWEETRVYEESRISRSTSRERSPRPYLQTLEMNSFPHLRYVCCFLLLYINLDIQRNIQTVVFSS